MLFQVKQEENVFLVDCFRILLLLTTTTTTTCFYNDYAILSSSWIYILTPFSFRAAFVHRRQSYVEWSNQF